ncbi:Transcription factor CYCLOIDEA like [Quillaja saponaria]|uniref:Transcription factor CYCLOIDEA like n=2 Tax=Quillaja saponaria TaxID=32244 RepID=A0AAD7PJ35_QUISA|nr:Transcription factor CYCLOIDEA like [Quillaja saponaria]KAJ7956580.1 Transcription factor CYCLOIDEA like [Quillaja saponaria]
MYPSNSANNGNFPISYPDQVISFSNRPFLNDISISFLTSKPEENQPPPPLSFLQFPSPFENDDIFLQHDLLLNQQYQTLADDAIEDLEISNKNVHSTVHSNMSTDQIPRKKPSKRDRHSKINTARGLRDRRMRLSLEVAKKFFGLQDMLGYDKASKTVDWLLNQAKAEIKQLARAMNDLNCNTSVGVKSPSSTSDCEGLSGLDEVAVNRSNQQREGESSAKEKKTRQFRTSAFHPLAKESREKARARARERTEKNKSRNQLLDKSKTCKEATNHNLSQFGSWSSFRTGGESGTHSQNMYMSLDVLAEVEKGSYYGKQHLGTLDDSSVIFDSLQNAVILPDHQFAELQSSGILWEPYNNHNIC